MSTQQQRPVRTRKARRRGLRARRERAAAVAALIVAAVAVLLILITSISGSGSHSASSSNPSTQAASSSPGAAGSASHNRPVPGSASVPILVYHVINTAPVGSSADPALYVPTDEFTSQMNALKAAGWHAVTLDQLQNYWTRGKSLGPGKPFVITFDNGYASQSTNALPVLKGLGWPAVEDLQVTGLSSSEGGLTPTQIKGMIAAGWELDTQGDTHVNLTTIDPTQLTSEIQTARQTLQSQYGVKVNWFSYPSGDYDATVIAAVKSAGYTGATTVNPGWASPKQDRFRLPRLPVTAGTSPSQLLSQIAEAQSTTTVPDSFTSVGLA